MSLVSRRHVTLLDNCWCSSQRGFAAWIDSSWGKRSQTRCLHGVYQLLMETSEIHRWSFTHLLHPFPVCLLTPNSPRSSVYRYIPLAQIDFLMWTQPTAPAFLRCLALSFRDTSPTVGFWNFQLLVSSSSLFFPLSLSTWHLLWPFYCSDMGQPIRVWHGKYDRRCGEVQLYPWLSEAFLCPSGRKHDIIPSSWPALNWIISGDQEHLYSITSRHLLLSFQKPDVSSKTQLCFIHRQVQPLLHSQFASKALKNMGWSTCSWVFSKLRFCFLTALLRLTYVLALSFCAGMCLFISMKTSMVRSFLLFLHISWIAS